MSFRFRRASVRLAVGLIATAIPLVGASVAQAAMAGGNQMVTTSRPDLVSVAATGATSATFCFDKTLTAIADVGGFYLGGYKADATAKSTNAVINGKCANVTVTVSPWFTFGTVGEGAVRAANIGNRADSVALGGSNTNNGTRGRSTAPDLTGISVVSGSPQQIAFTFDEPVNGAAVVGNGGFHFVTSQGVNCPVVACDIPSNTAAVSPTDPTTVIAQFPIGGVPLVTQAVRGYTVPGAVVSATNATPDGYDSSPNAGSSSGVVTGVPTLVSANYSRQPGTADVFAGTGGAAGVRPCGTVGSNNCVAVDYTFNEGVSVNQGTLTNFFAYLSNGSYVNPTAVTEPSGTNGTGGVYTGSTTVRAFFAPANGADARPFDEYLVKAGVAGAGTTANLGSVAAPLTGGCVAAQVVTAAGPLDTCAVVSTTTGHPNTPGSAPIGGNTGGHAAGFTTAPDAFSTQFDTQTNTVSVQLDQRTYAPVGTPIAPTTAAEAANFQLLDANGNSIAGGTNISSCSPSTIGFPCPLPSTPATAGAPGNTTIWVIYPSPAVQVGNAKFLEIRGQIGGPPPGSIPFGFALIGGDEFNTAPASGSGGPNPSSVVDPFDAGNVQQILSPTAVAAHEHLRQPSHWSHTRATKKRVADVLKHTKHHGRSH